MPQGTRGKLRPSASIYAALYSHDRPRSVRRTNCFSSSSRAWRSSSIATDSITIALALLTKERAEETKAAMTGRRGQQSYTWDPCSKRPFGSMSKSHRPICSQHRWYSAHTSSLNCVGGMTTPGTLGKGNENGFKMQMNIGQSS